MRQAGFAAAVGYNNRRMNYAQVLLWLIALALASLRIAGFTSLSFQASAHLFVGGLIGAWLVNRKRSLLILAIALSVVEVAVAFFGKG